MCCVTVVVVNVLAAMCVAVLFGDTEVDKALLFSNQRGMYRLQQKSQFSRFLKSLISLQYFRV